MMIQRLGLVKPSTVLSYNQQRFASNSTSEEGVTPSTPVAPRSRRWGLVAAFTALLGSVGLNVTQYQQGVNQQAAFTQRQTQTEQRLGELTEQVRTARNDISYQQEQGKKGLGDLSAQMDKLRRDSNTANQRLMEKEFKLRECVTAQAGSIDGLKKDASALSKQLGTLEKSFASQPPAIVQLDIQQRALAAKLQKASFLVTAAKPQDGSLGSSVLVRLGKDTLVLVSNHHVKDSVEKAHAGKDKRQAYLFKGQDGKTFTPKLLHTASDVDLAFFEVPAAERERLAPFALPLGDITSKTWLTDGMTVMACGNPVGLNLAISTGTLSRQPFSTEALDSMFQSPYGIQTTAPINPGNSGGGLVDSEGRVLGIAQSVARDSGEGVSLQGIGWAVPADVVLATAVSAKLYTPTEAETVALKPYDDFKIARADFMAKEKQALTHITDISKRLMPDGAWEAISKLNPGQLTGQMKHFYRDHILKEAKDLERTFAVDPLVLQQKDIEKTLVPRLDMMLSQLLKSHGFSLKADIPKKADDAAKPPVAPPPPPEEKAPDAAKPPVEKAPAPREVPPAPALPMPIPTKEPD